MRRLRYCDAIALWEFQSTHPVWDATPKAITPYTRIVISIHASRMGCDQCWQGNSQRLVISIHASRMGCDLEPDYGLQWLGGFQSTHPVWDATSPARSPDGSGRDFNPRIPYGMRPAAGWPPRKTVADFNPRIPYGMRLSPCMGFLWCVAISIHASRMGCD